MTETARKKNPGLRRPKRTVPQQLAKTSPPTSSAPPSNPPLPLRTRSEPQLDLPPRYSVLFPPEQTSLPQRPPQSLHPPSHTSPLPSGGLLPPPATSNGFQNTSSNALLDIPVVNPERLVNNTFVEQQQPSSEEIAHEALRDLISTKFDSVITSIDGEQFGGEEKELLVRDDVQSGIRGGWGTGNRQVSRGANRAISTAVVGTNYFAKANLYANSRLPPNLPPLQLYLPSYPLLCLAAQYSQRAYNKPTGSEREAFVNADWRMGTKAMVIKSMPIDDMNCVVFAIRGSQTFMDWAVNLNSSPVSPKDFLDDPGNLCHSGFLSVANKMIKPVAARLRSLLAENPARSSCSLLMTGHSAGGAVASLLYAHMLAEQVKSELNTLTGCFKRIHCLTFGTPPISLLPLTKPPTFRYKKSLFMSFINEGDPVPRADKAYVRSLLNLYASPAPGSKCIASLPALKPCKRKAKPKKATDRRENPPSAPNPPTEAPVWKVPAGALSNAGRLVVLRENKTSTTEVEDDVKAEITCDQELRGVVFGDPVMHMMKVYAKRVEILATKAVTAKIWG
ncbi:hypothetical protein IMSHALPRED_008955 [Imshaugia aleurites]|uniref:Fungal lipase-type domain-containing protein n=1 Tax=Imshaugia aleurites TaxID=172621 RepID=A0A8H3IUF2_9LECA|nr:hypothetical protein IMSHALPRED_008955 [Imshaugia aleurites]